MATFPPRALHRQHSDTHSTTTNQHLASKTPWGPPPKNTLSQHMPQLDWTSHLRWARSIQSPIADHTKLDPSLCWAIEQTTLLPNIHQIRLDVLRQIADIISEFQPTTSQWFQQLPHHCQKAYQQSIMITQIPALTRLLHTMQYPHLEQLYTELSQGFKLLGHLHPSLNWHVRTDQKYTEPISIAELRAHNRQYMHKKVPQNHTDPYWELMANEIATEVQQGRMAGPFRASEWLETSTVPLSLHEHTKQLTPLPHQDPIIALAFSIRRQIQDSQRRRLATIRTQQSLPHDRPTLPPHSRPLHMVSAIHSQTPQTTTIGVGTRPRRCLQTATSR